MKKPIQVALCLLALGGLASPALSADDQPNFKRMTAPGQLSVKSIEEQELDPAIKEKVREQVRLMKQHKVIPVSDHRVPDFSAIEADHRSRGKAFDKLVADKKLKFSPANIDATALKGQTMAGAIPSGIYTNQSWSGVSRMFHHPGLRYVILEETDLAKTGGGATFTKEMINADVNGAPAILLSKQGGPKKSESSLMWFSDGVLYLLRTPGVNDKAREELLEIAKSISK